MPLFSETPICAYHVYNSQLFMFVGCIFKIGCASASYLTAVNSNYPPGGPIQGLGSIFLCLFLLSCFCFSFSIWVYCLCFLKIKPLISAFWEEFPFIKSKLRVFAFRNAYRFFVLLLNIYLVDVLFNKKDPKTQDRGALLLLFLLQACWQMTAA